MDEEVVHLLFPGVGSMDPRGAPLFLEISYDSVAPLGKVVPAMADYSADYLFFDMECATGTSKVTGSSCFPIAWVNKKALENQYARVYLERESYKKLKFWKPPYSKNQMTLIEREQFETKHYSEALVKKLGAEVFSNPKYAGTLPKGTKSADLVPNPATDTSPVICICFAVSNLRNMNTDDPCGAEDHYILTVIPKDAPPDYVPIVDSVFKKSARFSNVKLVACDSEFDLLMQFMQHIRGIFPCSLGGYNVNNFDIPYIENRIKWYEVYGQRHEKEFLRNHPYNLGLMAGFHRNHKVKTVSRPNSGTRDVIMTYPCLLPVLDSMEALSNETFSQPGKYKSFKLSAMAQCLNYAGTDEPMVKLMVDVTQGERMWITGGDQCNLFLFYCLWDSLLSLGLCRFHSFAELSDTVCSVTGVRPHEVYPTGVGLKIVSLHNSINSENGKRFLMPTFNGGMMPLMHHPDIWLFDPKKNDNHSDSAKPYDKHSVCLIGSTYRPIPHIYEVIERRFADRWRKGSTRNFGPSKYTPNGRTEEEEYVYGDSYQWLVKAWKEGRSDTTSSSSFSSSYGIGDGSDEDWLFYTSASNPFVSMHEIQTREEREAKRYEETVSTALAGLNPNFDKQEQQRKAKTKRKNTTDEEGDDEGEEDFDSLSLTDSSEQEDDEEEEEEEEEQKEEQEEKKDENGNSTNKERRSRIPRPEDSEDIEMEDNPGDGDRIAKRKRKLTPMQEFNKKLKELVTLREKAEKGDKHAQEDPRILVLESLIKDLIVKKVEKEQTEQTTTTVGKGKKKKKKKFQGGFVMNMLRGFYPNWSIFYDFVSLYPSIMQAFFICYNTFLTAYTKNMIYKNHVDALSYNTIVLGSYYESICGDYRYDPVRAKECGNIDSNELAETYWVQDPDCMTRAMIMKLMDLRREAKGDMGFHIGASLCWELDGKSVEDVEKRLKTDLKLKANMPAAMQKKILEACENLSSCFVSTTTTTTGEKNDEERGRKFSAQIFLPSEADLNPTTANLATLRIKYHRNQHKKFNSRQNGYKITLNSSYGIMGKGHGLGLPEGASAVTAKGRDQIQGVNSITKNTCVVGIISKEMGKAQELVSLGVHPGVIYPNEFDPEKNPKCNLPIVTKEHRKRLKNVDTFAQPVGGDTDSTFVYVSPALFPNTSEYFPLVKAFAFYQARLIQRFLPAEIQLKPANPARIFSLDDYTKRWDDIVSLNHEWFDLKWFQSLAVEKISDYFSGMGKKRYSFRDFEKRDIVHKGSAMVRGDSIPWASDRLKICYKKIFSKPENGKSEADKIADVFIWLIEELQHLAAGNYEISDLVTSQKLKKEPSAYCQNTPPHARVAQKMLERGDTSVGSGTNVRYLYYLDPDIKDTKFKTKVLSGKMRSMTVAKQNPIFNKKENKDVFKNFKEVNAKKQHQLPTHPLPLVPAPAIHKNQHDKGRSSRGGGGGENHANLPLTPQAICMTLFPERWQMLQNRQKSMTLPGHYRLADTKNDKNALDTPEEVIRQGFVVNLPHYVERIKRTLAIALSPFISENKSYPALPDGATKAQVAFIEGMQKKFVEEQVRQVYYLITTPLLTSRLSTILKRHEAKINELNGIQGLVEYGVCLLCKNTYTNSKPKRLVNLKAAVKEEKDDDDSDREDDNDGNNNNSGNQQYKDIKLEICQKCLRNSTLVKEYASTQEKEMETENKGFIKCLEKCEKCILRTEVGLTALGMQHYQEKTNIGNNNKTDPSTSHSIVDIENLWETMTVTKSPFWEVGDRGGNSGNKGQIPKIEVRDEDLHDNKWWVVTPKQCLHTECKIYKEKEDRYIRYIKYQSNLRTIEPLLSN
jgi:DNA polymerase elongation subunit (family B)